MSIFNQLLIELYLFFMKIYAYLCIYHEKYQAIISNYIQPQYLYEITCVVYVNNNITNTPFTIYSNNQLDSIYSLFFSSNYLKLYNPFYKKCQYMFIVTEIDTKNSIICYSVTSKSFNDLFDKKKALTLTKPMSLTVNNIADENNNSVSIDVIANKYNYLMDENVLKPIFFKYILSKQGYVHKSIENCTICILTHNFDNKTYVLKTLETQGIVL